MLAWCSFQFFQPLVFTTFSVVKAEEMADLIDGYCFLIGGAKHSLVFKKLGKLLHAIFLSPYKLSLLSTDTNAIS